MGRAIEGVVFESMCVNRAGVGHKTASVHLAVAHGYAKQFIAVACFLTLESL